MKITTCLLQKNNPPKPQSNTVPIKLQWYTEYSTRDCQNKAVYIYTQNQNQIKKKRKEMHVSENEGIEGKTFVITGGLGYVGAALCLELIRRGARQVRTLDLRATSPWSFPLSKAAVVSITGITTYLCFHFGCFFDSWLRWIKVKSLAKLYEIVMNNNGLI